MRKPFFYMCSLPSLLIGFAVRQTVQRQTVQKENKHLEYVQDCFRDLIESILHFRSYEDKHSTFSAPYCRAVSFSRLPLINYGWFTELLHEHFLHYRQMETRPNW